MLIVTLVFAAVFLLVTVLDFSIQAEPAARRKMTAARLAAIPTSEGFRESYDELEGFVRRDELSTTPWLNRLLGRLDVLEQLRKVLVQADSKWTVAQLLAYCAASASAGFLAAYWRTGEPVAASLVAC